MSLETEQSVNPLRGSSAREEVKRIKKGKQQEAEGWEEERDRGWRDVGEEERGTDGRTGDGGVRARGGEGRSSEAAAATAQTEGAHGAAGHSTPQASPWHGATPSGAWGPSDEGNTGIK